MFRKRRWLWIFLFILASLLLGVLATGWNLFLLSEHQRLLGLARMNPPALATEAAPWYLIPLGTVGFAGALFVTSLFFVKILKEMRLNQIQSEFLATVSHELKTPIASIELSSSLLRQGGLPQEEVGRLWESHQQELRRLQEDVEEILEAARWGSKPPDPELKRISMEQWLQESIVRWRSMLGPRATLKRVGDTLSGNIFADERALNLITDNLISNARKYSVGSPKVTIVTRRVPGSGIWRKSTWQIRFKDEGRGFPPSESRRIFHRFFRARHNAPYAIPGTGLGLYLASNASRAMGITISAFSRGLGKGAVFTLKGQER